MAEKVFTSCRSTERFDWSSLNQPGDWFGFRFDWPKAERQIKTRG